MLARKSKGNNGTRFLDRVVGVLRFPRLGITVDTGMNAPLSNFLQGTVYLATGIALLEYRDEIAKFEERSGGVGGWIKKKLGDSFLNRDLWPARKLSYRQSKIWTCIFGVIMVFGGVVMLGLSFFEFLEANGKHSP